jgi:hypothetical protein
MASAETKTWFHHNSSFDDVIAATHADDLLQSASLQKSIIQSASLLVVQGMNCSSRDGEDDRKRQGSGVGPTDPKRPLNKEFNPTIRG